MSYTNSTEHYNLPQYIGTDKPTYLGDMNGAYRLIDGKLYEAIQNSSNAVDITGEMSQTVANISQSNSENSKQIAEIKTSLKTVTNTANNNKREIENIKGSIPNIDELEETVTRLDAGYTTLNQKTQSLETNQSNLSSKVDGAIQDVQNTNQALINTNNNLNTLNTKADETQTKTNNLLAQYLSGVPDSGKMVFDFIGKLEDPFSISVCVILNSVSFYSIGKILVMGNTIVYVPIKEVKQAEANISVSMSDQKTQDGENYRTITITTNVAHSAIYLKAERDYKFRFVSY